MENCPFRAGDWVIYKPSSRGRGLIIMTDLSKLVPYRKYKVSRIEDNNYIVVEGFENSVPSGLFWTEFEPANENSDFKGEDLEYLGKGPNATGTSGGWEFKNEIYVRCGECGDFLHPWGAKDNFGCSCGGLFFDIDSGRFTPQEGDNSVEVFRTR